MKKILVSILATFVAVTGLLSGAGAAQATESLQPGATVDSPTNARAVTATRSIKATYTRISRSAFAVRAGISPNYRNRVAVLEYRLCKTCRWTQVRKANTNLNGVANLGTINKVGWYRVKSLRDRLYDYSYSTESQFVSS